MFAACTQEGFDRHQQVKLTPLSELRSTGHDNYGKIPTEEQKHKHENVITIPVKRQLGINSKGRTKL